MKPTLTPALRSELTRAAATLKQAIATARADGAHHLEALSRHQEWVNGEAQGLIMGPSAGAFDVAGVVARRAEAVGMSEASVNEVKQRLLVAVESTQELQAKVFSTVHKEVRAEVKQRLADLCTPAQMDGVTTELESRMGGLRLRLAFAPDPRTFTAVLAWAELTQHVLADLAADKLEFHAQPEEAKAA